MTEKDRVSPGHAAFWEALGLTLLMYLVFALNGVFNDSARERFVEVIANLREDGCDAVALVCTEFPLLIAPENSPLPTLDSTDLLARASVRAATGEDDLPSWRGGPPA